MGGKDPQSGRPVPGRMGDEPGLIPGKGLGQGNEDPELPDQGMVLSAEPEDHLQGFEIKAEVYGPTDVPFPRDRGIRPPHPMRVDVGGHEGLRGGSAE